MRAIGTARIINANSRNLPLDGVSVDLIVTSPPYFALRSYQDGGKHYEGQIGDEPTPSEFVASLLEVTRECMRVLKPTGSLWVNLGDKYAGTKSLIGVPWRYALACIDDLGLILRAEVIWSKPNGLPESVTDRVRRSHEQWFHFTKEPRYFSAVDEIREAHNEAQRPGVLTWEQRKGRVDKAAAYGPDNGHGGTAGMAQSPLGKLPGSVWTVPTEPLRVPDWLGVDHFAAFPIEWPKRIIQGWSAPGMTVLDPFGGTGTTAMVAKALGRHGISVDMSADYCRIAEWRTSDRDQLAKVLGVEKTDPTRTQDESLLDLLDGGDAA